MSFVDMPGCKNVASLKEKKMANAITGRLSGKT
jgi:hypothetical protein